MGNLREMVQMCGRWFACLLAWGRERPRLWVHRPGHAMLRFASFESARLRGDTKRERSPRGGLGERSARAVWPFELRVARDPHRGFAQVSFARSDKPRASHARHGEHRQEGSPAAAYRSCAWTWGALQLRPQGVQPQHTQDAPLATDRTQMRHCFWWVIPSPAASHTPRNRTRSVLYTHTAVYPQVRKLRKFGKTYVMDIAARSKLSESTKIKNRLEFWKRGNTLRRWSS